MMSPFEALSLIAFMFCVVDFISLRPCLIKLG